MNFTYFCLPYIHYLSLDNKHLFFPLWLPFLHFLSMWVFFFFFSGGTRVTVQCSGRTLIQASYRELLPVPLLGPLRKMYSLPWGQNISHFHHCVSKAAWGWRQADSGIFEFFASSHTQTKFTPWNLHSSSTHSKEKKKFLFILDLVWVWFL